MNELIIRSENAFASKALNASTKRIAKAIGGVRKNYYAIAKELYNVHENDLYSADGFKSAADYAEKVFGIKVAQAYNLIRIGKDYTTPELTSNLPHEEGEDFTTTQVIKMFPVGGRDEVVNFVNDCNITPEMTTKEISDAVKRYRNAGDEEVESDNAEEAESDNTVKDADGCERDLTKILKIMQKYSGDELHYLMDEIVKAFSE